MRREDFEAVGGLSDRYQVGMFEDDELAERIRRLGKRVVCAEDVFVHHAGSAAFRTIDPVVYQAIFDRNRRVFETAVGRPWRPHTHRHDKTTTAGTRLSPAKDDSSPSRPASAEPSRIPQLSYLVCGSHRSGTNFFCSLLESSSIAGRPREYFQPEFMNQNMADWNAPSLSAYIEEVLRRGTTANGVFAAKLLWEYFCPFVEELRLVAAVPGMTDSSLLEEAFGSLRYVWIYRNNTVAQAVSWAKAVQTAQWTASEKQQRAPRFDFDLIHAYVKLAIEHRLGWQHWFDQHSISPVTVVYEDLVADTDAVVHWVLAQIGIEVRDEAHFNADPYSRQSDALNAEWIERYRTLTGLRQDQHPQLS